MFKGELYAGGKVLTKVWHFLKTELVIHIQKICPSIDQRNRAFPIHRKQILKTYDVFPLIFLYDKITEGDYDVLLESKIN